MAISQTTDQWIRKWGLFASSSAGVLALSEGNDNAGQEQLHFIFHTRQPQAGVPGTAIVRLYNPAPTTVSSVINEYQLIRIQAGYQTGRYGLIFQGTLKQWKYGKEDPATTFLELYLADADLPLNFATINKTLKAGYTQKDVYDAVTTEFQQNGASVGHKVDLMGAPSVRGDVLYGMATDEMNEVIRTNRAVWWVENGQVISSKPDQTLPGETIVLNYQTGLVGFPEQTQQGILATCLLNPSIHIGRLIQINNKAITQTGAPANSDTGSSNITVFPGPRDLNVYAALNADGYYRPLVVEHAGDTRGNEWYTTMVCRANSSGGTNNPQSPFPSQDDIARAGKDAVNSGRIS